MKRVIEIGAGAEPITEEQESHLRKLLQPQQIKMLLKQKEAVKIAKRVSRLEKQVSKARSKKDLLTQDLQRLVFDLNRELWHEKRMARCHSCQRIMAAAERRLAMVTTHATLGPGSDWYDVTYHNLMLVCDKCWKSKIVEPAQQKGSSYEYHPKDKSKWLPCDPDQVRIFKRREEEAREFPRNQELLKDVPDFWAIRKRNQA